MRLHASFLRNVSGVAGDGTVLSSALIAGAIDLDGPSCVGH